MRLFIAREAVDPHLAVAGGLVDPKAPLSQEARRAAAGRWASTRGGTRARWSGWGQLAAVLASSGRSRGHVRFVERDDAPALAHDLPPDGAPRPEAREAAGPALPRRGHRRGPLRDVGRGCRRAQAMRRAGSARGREAVELADVFCRGDAPPHRRALRARSARTTTSRKYETARRLLDGEHLWLEQGLVPSEELEKMTASLYAHEGKELASI